LSFLMPFAYISTSIFPFIVGKILYFQAIVQLIFAVYLLLLVVNFNRFKPKKNLLLYWFYFYAVSLLLSAIFGVDFERSFWSNFERMTGVFVVFHFITYSIIVSIVFDSWSKVKRALQVLLGVSVLQMFVVMMQYIKPGVYLYPNVGGRVWGTLGNSIYIGSYFLFHIFFALLLAFKERKNQILQSIYILIALLQVYIIVHSKSSRGADLALAFGICVIIFGYSVLSKNKKLKEVVLSFVLLAVILLGFAIGFRKTETVKNIPLVGTLVNSSLSDGTGRTRAIAWEIAWISFKERPIFGAGLENFYYLFNTHYNPESLRHSYYETWFDRSHSIIFDTLSLGGSVGFISYFGLFVIGAWMLYGAYKKENIDKHILIFVPIVFATYLIQNLFVFDHPGSYFLLYFSFGILLSLVSINKQEEYIEPNYTLTNSIFYIISFGFLILFFILFYGTSVKTYKAAIAIIDAERVFVNNINAGVKRYDEVLKMKTPFINDMRLSMAKRIIRVTNEQVKSAPAYKDVLLFARNEMLKEVDNGTRDVYNYIVLGQIDMLLAVLDPSYLDSADDFFSKARDLSPERQQIYYTWAKLKIIKGENDEAIKLLEEALSFDEEESESYWYLGLAYESQGDKETAWKYLNTAIDKIYNWKSDQEVLFIISLGESLNKYEGLVRLYQTAIERNSSAELYVNLGNVYTKLGKKEESLDAYRQANLLNPNLFKPKE